MSYEKMLKRTNGHNHDKDYQPMLFAMEGEHIESLNSIAERTAKSFNVRVRNDISEDFIQISKEFPTEYACGSVTCGNVSGDIDAGGSVRCRR